MRKSGLYARRIETVAQADHRLGPGGGKIFVQPLQGFPRLVRRKLGASHGGKPGGFAKMQVRDHQYPGLGPIQRPGRQGLKGGAMK